MIVSTKKMSPRRRTELKDSWVLEKLLITEDVLLRQGQPFSKTAPLTDEIRHPSPNTPESSNENPPNASVTEQEDHDADRDIAAEMFFSVFAHDSYNLLNCLEHISMAINCGVADGDILYPSLHQVFISMVASLYIFICNSNSKSPVDRYYTQITALYRLWDEKTQAFTRHVEELAAQPQHEVANNRRKKLK